MLGKSCPLHYGYNIYKSHHDGVSCLHHYSMLWSATRKMAVNFEKDLILVTGAGGKQARPLLPLLSQRWKRLRLAVQSVESQARLQEQYRNAEVVRCDLADPHACNQLVSGVSACYLVTPSLTPTEARCGYNVIDAALANRASGGPFEHFVFASAFHPILSKLINHKSKRDIEEYLVESGLPYTILQPAHFMETVPLGLIVNSPQEKPSMPCLRDPDVPVSLTSTRDIAQAAANVIEGRDKHLYATYQLCGTAKPLTYNEMAAIISKAIGKDIQVERKSLEDGIRMFSSMTAKGRQPDNLTASTGQFGFAAMNLFASYWALIGNTNVLEMLLGRKPLQYDQWVEESVRELKA